MGIISLIILFVISQKNFNFFFYSFLSTPSIKLKYFLHVPIGIIGGDS